MSVIVGAVSGFIAGVTTMEVTDSRWLGSLVTGAIAASGVILWDLITDER